MRNFSKTTYLMLPFFNDRFKNRIDGWLENLRNNVKKLHLDVLEALNGKKGISYGLGNLTKKGERKELYLSKPELQVLNDFLLKYAAEIRRVLLNKDYNLEPIERCFNAFAKNIDNSRLMQVINGSNAAAKFAGWHAFNPYTQNKITFFPDEMIREIRRAHEKSNEYAKIV